MSLTRRYPEMPRKARLLAALGSLAILAALHGASHTGLVVQQGFNDTVQYRTPLSWATWNVLRPPVVPAVYTLLGDANAIALFQRIVSLVAWIVLAAAIGRHVRTPRLRMIACGLIVIMMFGREVLFWNHVLLSESLALSLMSLWLASLLRFLAASRPTWIDAACLAATSWLTCSVRDAHAYLILSTGVLLAAAALPRGPRRRAAAAVAAFSLGVGFWQVRAAAMHERFLVPLTNVMTMRVLADDGLRAHFAERGLPTDERALCFKGKLFFECPGLDARDVFGAYLLGRGRSDYQHFLLTHAAYSLGEPASAFEGLAGADLANWYQLDKPSANAVRDALETLAAWVPPRQPGFFLGSAAVALVLAGIAWVVHRKKAGVSARGVFCAWIWLLSAELAWISYHGDAIEVARHSVISIVFFRLATLMTAIYALDAFFQSRSSAAIQRPLSA